VTAASLLAAIPEPVVLAGYGAGALAILGLILLAPLLLVQRRDVDRMLRWQELEPDSGDDPAFYIGSDAGGTTTAARPTDPSLPMTPMQRVTSERPALERITMERAALESPSLLVRLRAGLGPRHPLVILLAGTLLAAAILAVVLLVIVPLSDDDGGERGPFDPAEVEVAVFNASGAPGVGERVAGELEGAGFTLQSNSALDLVRQTAVMYAPGQKLAGKKLSKELDIAVLQPISAAVAREAPEAEAVVILGEDQGAR